ncbi:MAG: serine/threonine protein kinase [Gammaproteobacteria bacterium]|nr:serine/threonine protein kinase [Gammaproteobacteria bacterium]
MSGYHPSALPRGHHLAEYEIESNLGQGGFGMTYLARDTSLGSLVAIKEYLPHQLAARASGKTQIVPNLDSREAVKDYQWGLKRFLAEAQALARFKHPNIVRVLRFMEANGTAYMVMEYEKGQSLGDYLKQHNNRLDENDLIRIYLPILNGLDAVHQAGLLHLDIKPDNIYLRQDGSPMLIDFGSARQSMSSHGLEKVVLTPGYAPAEQYPGQGEQGPWTDIYALGASMYRCIRGKRPASGLERYQTILKLQVDPLTPAVKFGEGRYQKRILECIDWAMRAYPTDRPKSARALQDAMLGRGRPIANPALQVQSKEEFKEKTRQIKISSRKGSGASSSRKLLYFVLFLVAAAYAVYYFWPQLVQQWPELRIVEQWLYKAGLYDIDIPRPDFREWLHKLKKMISDLGALLNRF